jgi:hydroxymethylpyrimidine pyrophosphatase-like HAD family hydrolase
MENPPASAIRALFFDLDGTLLNSKREITDSTLSALRSCAEKGIGIFVATARPPNIDKQLALSPERAKLVRDGVFLNGACVRRGGSDAFSCLGRETAWEVMLRIAGEDPRVNISLQCADGRHGFRRPLPAAEWGLWGLRGQGDILDYPEKFEELPGDILKMIIFERFQGRFLGKSLEAIHAALSGLCSLYLSDGGAVIQAMEASVSKKSGIERVMAGLLPHEIAVFGDDVNDREMLSAFPHSVAMGNAPPEVAALARYGTASNDDDGIAFALRRLLHLIP